MIGLITSNPGGPESFKLYKYICFLKSILPDVFILRKFFIFDLVSSTGGFFNELSISKMRLFFQFNRIICQLPNAIKMKIKKIIKTENKNLCFKGLNLTSPDIDGCE